MLAVNAGARLDRLPASRFHYRILGLIGGGMFLDAFEIYLQGAVLAALIGIGWSTPAQNANFLSATFAGMVIGAWLAGITGDRYGRRFSYQVNLLIFGLASLAGAAAPSMEWLIAARFVMGIGLGAEIVVGYVTISELTPPASRGRWGAGLATITNSALFFAALAGRLIIPSYGWRWMFVIVGVGALIVWYLRKRMPESPRWLEANGRNDEAERVISEIEAEVERSTGRKLPAAANILEPSSVNAVGRLSDLFSRDMIARTITGSVILIALNTAIYGFLAFLPSFMVRQGLTITTSLNYVTLISLGGPAGALLGMALADKVGRKPCIVCLFAHRHRQRRDLPATLRSDIRDADRLYSGLGDLRPRRCGLGHVCSGTIPDDDPHARGRLLQYPRAFHDDPHTTDYDNALWSRRPDCRIGLCCWSAAASGHCGSSVRNRNQADAAGGTVGSDDRT